MVLVLQTKHQTSAKKYMESVESCVYKDASINGQIVSATIL